MRFYGALASDIFRASVCIGCDDDERLLIARRIELDRFRVDLDRNRRGRICIGCDGCDGKRNGEKQAQRDCKKIDKSVVHSDYHPRYS